MAQRITSIRFPFGIDAGAGRLQTEPDYERHVEQMIRQVLLTDKGERVNRPDFGAGLRRLVFAPNSPATASLAQTAVFEAIESTMSSILRVEDVQVESDEETLRISLRYKLLARPTRRVLNLEVTL